jgi:hypothetical protein
MDANVRVLIRLLREEGYTGTLYRDDTVNIATGYPGDVYTQWNIDRRHARFAALKITSMLPPRSDASSRPPAGEYRPLSTMNRLLRNRK